MTKLLRITAPRFVAGAVFEKRNVQWIVTHCAPILNWLRKLPLDQMDGRLRKIKAKWEWMEI